MLKLPQVPDSDETIDKPESPQQPGSDELGSDEPTAVDTSGIGESKPTEANPALFENVCISGWLDDRRLLMIVAGALVGLFALALLAMLYFAKAVFFPVTLAVILKLIFSPVVRRLNAWHIPNFVGAGFVVATILGVMLAGVVFLSGPALEWFDEAPDHFRDVKYKLRSLKEPMKKVSDAGDEVAGLTDVHGKKKPVPVEVKQPSVPSSLLNTTGAVAAGVFLTIVLLYFLLAGGDRFLEKLVSLAPAWRNKRKIVSLARDIQRSMSSYLFATTCINVALGIVIGLGMWFAGLPNPVLWGVLAACLNFIPYFGCIIGACIVFLVGLISLDSVGDAAWAPAIYIFVNAIEGYFITPAVLGRSISLSPLAIIVGMIVWGWLWGVGGMLLAVPILAAVKIACGHIPPLEPVGRLLGR